MALSDGEFSNQLAVAHNNQELKTQKSHNNPNSQTATINNSALDTLISVFPHKRGTVAVVWKKLLQVRIIVKRVFLKEYMLNFIPVFNLCVSRRAASHILF